MLISCAVATRPFALLLGPFVLFGNSRGKILGGEISFAIALLALHAPFGFGQVVGSLRTFAGEWEFNSSVFALLKIAFGLTAARVICLLLLVVVCVVVYWRWFFFSVNPVRRIKNLPALECLILFAAVFFLSPVANPWYALWLLPFLAALTSPHIWAWTLLVTCSLSYITSLNLGGEMGYTHPVWVRPLEFVPVIVAGVFQLSVSRQSKRGSV